MTPDTDEIAARMRAGLDGVTPGEWVHFSWTAGDEVQSARSKTAVASWAGFDDCHRSKAEHSRNAAHIANCSPDNIAAILDALAAAQARVKVLEEGLRPFAGLVDGESSDESGNATVLLLILGGDELGEVSLHRFRRARALLEDRSDDR